MSQSHVLLFKFPHFANLFSPTAQTDFQKNREERFCESVQCKDPT